MALAQRTGRPPPTICQQLDISPADLADREVSYPKSRMDAMWDRALVLSGDPGFGLSLPELLVPGVLGPVEYLARSMATLQEGYQQAVRFQNLLQRNTSRWHIDETPTHTRYRYVLVPPLAPAHRHIVEFACATFVKLGRLAAAEPWVPARVTFTHARGALLSRYKDAFGCAPHFEGEANEVVLDTAARQTPMSGEDAHLAAIVREYAERRQSAFSSEATADAVRLVVSETMHLGEVALASVAERLDTTERTLRRRLAAENTSFQALVDEVRFDVAKSYLERGDMTTDEIALLLGFSEVSAFYRAFRRWYGGTLSAYRQSPIK